LLRSYPSFNRSIVELKGFECSVKLFLMEMFQSVYSRIESTVVGLLRILTLRFQSVYSRIERRNLKEEVSSNKAVSIGL